MKTIENGMRTILCDECGAHLHVADLVERRTGFLWLRKELMLSLYCPYHPKKKYYV